MKYSPQSPVRNLNASTHRVAKSARPGANHPLRRGYRNRLLGGALLALLTAFGCRLPTASSDPLAIEGDAAPTASTDTSADGSASTGSATTAEGGDAPSSDDGPAVTTEVEDLMADEDTSAATDASDNAPTSAATDSSDRATTSTSEDGGSMPSAAAPAPLPFPTAPVTGAMPTAGSLGVAPVGGASMPSAAEVTAGFEDAACAGAFSACLLLNPLGYAECARENVEQGCDLLTEPAAGAVTSDDAGMPTIPVCDLEYADCLTLHPDPAGIAQCTEAYEACTPLARNP